MGLISQGEKFIEFSKESLLKYEGEISWYRLVWHLTVPSLNTSAYTRGAFGRVRLITDSPQSPVYSP